MKTHHDKLYTRLSFSRQNHDQHLKEDEKRRRVLEKKIDILSKSAEATRGQLREDLKKKTEINYLKRMD